MRRADEFVGKGQGHDATGVNQDEAFQIRPMNANHREILIRMYRSFEPLGLALGLPPINEARRALWIHHALGQAINFGAFSPAGELAGHSFLALSSMGEGEIALFVRQEYRRRGHGANLIRAILQWAAQERVRRIMGLIAAQDVPAARLLKRCGFRFSQYLLPAMEFDIEVAAPT